eukprot:766393-Hanusia_phi.AAC.14
MQNQHRDADVVDVDGEKQEEREMEGCESSYYKVEISDRRERMLSKATTFLREAEEAKSRREEISARSYRVMIHVLDDLARHLNASYHPSCNKNLLLPEGRQNLSSDECAPKVYLDSVETLHANTQVLSLIEQGRSQVESKSRQELYMFYGSLEEEEEEDSRLYVPEEANPHITILHLRSSSTVVYDTSISMSRGDKQGTRDDRMQVCFSTRRNGVCVRVTVTDRRRDREDEEDGGSMLDFEFNVYLPGAVDEAKKTWIQTRSARKVVTEVIWPKIDENNSPVVEGP